MRSALALLCTCFPTGLLSPEPLDGWTTSQPLINIINNSFACRVILVCQAAAAIKPLLLGAVWPTWPLRAILLSNPHTRRTIWILICGARWLMIRRHRRPFTLSRETLISPGALFIFISWKANLWKCAAVASVMRRRIYCRGPAKKVTIFASQEKRNE